MNKIEILDKINNTYEKVEKDLDMLIIHPLNKESYILRDFILEGKKITGVIFSEDGTTMILYGNIKIKK